MSFSSLPVTCHDQNVCVRRCFVLIENGRIHQIRSGSMFFFSCLHRTVVMCGLIRGKTNPPIADGCVLQSVPESKNDTFDTSVITGNIYH